MQPNCGQFYNKGVKLKVSFTKQEVIDVLRSHYNLSANVEIVIEEQQQESHKATGPAFNVGET